MSSKLPIFLSTALISSVAMASLCDYSTITMVGPENYQFSIKLSTGTFNSKNNNSTQISQQSLSSSDKNYQVFSDTKDRIYGTVYLISPDNRENISINFKFSPHHSYHNPHCDISYVRQGAESRNFLAQVIPLGGNNLIFKISQLK